MNEKCHHGWYESGVTQRDIHYDTAKLRYSSSSNLALPVEGSGGTTLSGSAETTGISSLSTFSVSSAFVLALVSGMGDDGGGDSKIVAVPSSNESKNLLSESSLVVP